MKKSVLGLQKLVLVTTNAKIITNSCIIHLPK